MIREVVTCVLVVVASAAAWSTTEAPTEATSEETITNITTLNAKDLSSHTTPISSTVTIYRSGFESYEKRIKVFIENMQREYYSINTDSARFLGELDSYLIRLPMYNTKMVPKKYRSTCYCNGEMESPCPDECIHSCYRRCDQLYGYSSWRADPCDVHQADCSGSSSSSYATCRCYEGSSTSCDHGSISNCYEEKLVEVPSENQTCVDLTINHGAIRESFKRFSELLIEPLKILVRGLEFKLDSFKQSITAADLIANISSQFCDDNDPNCQNEQQELFSRKSIDLRQMKGNITLHMIKTHKKAESVAKDVDDLKEQIVHQLNEEIKNYTCCLKGLDVTVKGNDCDPKPVELPTMTVSVRNSRIQPQTVQLVNARKTCTYPSFECDNQKCISDSYRCDGTDDCGDSSDEADC